MRTYCNSQPWNNDPALVPLPWREVKLPAKLKIGFLWNDGIVTPHPPVRRALDEVARALRNHPDKFEVVDWIPLDHARCDDIAMGLYFEDGCRGIKEVLKKGGEQPRPLTQWIFDNERVKHKTIEEVWEVSFLEPLNMTLSAFLTLFWQLKAQRNDYRQQYNDYWLATGDADGHPVDAIISPVAPGAAYPHEKANYWLYTSQWNLLEYPGSSFPVTTVDGALDVKDEDYVPRNPRDRYNHDLYDPITFTDAPVGLQIITRKFEDEKNLAILEAVEMAMGRT